MINILAIEDYVLCPRNISKSHLFLYVFFSLRILWREICASLISIDIIIMKCTLIIHRSIVKVRKRRAGGRRWRRRRKRHCIKCNDNCYQQQWNFNTMFLFRLNVWIIHGVNVPLSTIIINYVVLGIVSFRFFLYAEKWIKLWQNINNVSWMCVCVQYAIDWNWAHSREKVQSENWMWMK